MWNKIFIVLLFYLTQWNTVQSMFDPTFYDAEGSVINPEYLTDFETFVTEDNSGIFLNFTLIKSFPKTTRFTYTLLGAALGEFVLRPGINFDVAFCDIYKPSYRIIGDQIELIGMTEDDCPPSPGVYGAEKVGYSATNLPDLFPPNNYLAVLRIFTKNEYILEYKIFARLAN